MSRIQQLADACPNADILACRVVEVSITRSSLVFVLTDFWTSHARLIFVFNLESMPWMMHLTMKQPTTSLPLLIAALSHPSLTFQFI
jgi:hypothetical protein